MIRVLHRVFHVRFKPAMAIKDIAPSVAKILHGRSCRRRTLRRTRWKSEWLHALHLRITWNCKQKHKDADSQQAGEHLNIIYQHLTDKEKYSSWHLSHSKKGKRFQLHRYTQLHLTTFTDYLKKKQKNHSIWNVHKFFSSWLDHSAVHKWIMPAGVLRQHFTQNKVFRILQFPGSSILESASSFP